MNSPKGGDALSYCVVKGNSCRGQDLFMKMVVRQFMCLKTFATLGTWQVMVRKGWIVVEDRGFDDSGGKVVS